MTNTILLDQCQEEKRGEEVLANQHQSKGVSDTDETLTKNIFVGNERIASVVALSTPAIYFYSSDHLGSTTYLTDDTGNIVERIEYTPWGEAWKQDNTTNDPNLPDYKFTGKEQDATKLYYYGARYYDPQASVWLSVDPILNSYLDSDIGMGGMYNSRNLGLFNYSHNNPVVLLDPDGLSPHRTTLYAGPGGDMYSKESGTYYYQMYIEEFEVELYTSPGSKYIMRSISAFIPATYYSENSQFLTFGLDMSDYVSAGALSSDIMSEIMKKEAAKASAKFLGKFFTVINLGLISAELLVAVEKYQQELQNVENELLKDSNYRQQLLEENIYEKQRYQCSDPSCQ